MNLSSVGSLHPPERGSIWSTSAGCSQRQKPQLCWQGGTGFDERTLAKLAEAFRPLIRSNPPFIQSPPEKNVTWLEPRRVAQIAFQEWTADQKLRQPVFLGLRDDKEPGEIELPERR
jgi:ATP-dependent DNA ligase